MRNSRYENEANKVPEPGEVAQPANPATAIPRQLRGKRHKFLLIAVLTMVVLVLILAIALPINASVSATIQNTAPTTSVQFSPDGRLLVSETTDSSVPQYAPHTVGGLPASDDTHYTVKVWNTASDTPLYSFPASSNTTDVGNQVQFSPDGRLLAVSSTRLANNPSLWRITLRESQHGTLLRTIAVDQPFVSEFAFSPDGRLLAVVTNTFNDANANPDDSFSLISLYDVASGALLHTLKGWIQGENFLFSPDSRTIAVGTNPYNSSNQAGYLALKLYNVASGRLLKSIAPADSLSADVYAFSKDGRTLLVFADSPDGNNYYDLDSINLVSSVATLSIERKEGHGLDRTALNPAQTIFAFSDWNDNSGLASAFTGMGSNTVSLWDATTGKQIRMLEERSGSYQTSTMNELAFSPDGRLLAGLGADNVIRIWDVTTGTLLRTLGGYLSKVNTLTFSPDSRLLVTGSGYTTFHFWTAYTIRIWDVQSGESLKEL